MKLPAILLGASVAATLAACSSCQPSPPQPSPPGPTPPVVTDYTVYEELVLAQCLSRDAGVQTVSEQHLSDRQQPWLACLYAGGNIESCQVPCPK